MVLKYVKIIIMNFGHLLDRVEGQLAVAHVLI